MSIIGKTRKDEFLETLFFDADKSPVALRGASTIFNFMRDVLKVKNFKYSHVKLFELFDLIRSFDRVI